MKPPPQPRAAAAEPPPPPPPAVLCRPLGQGAQLGRALQQARSLRLHHGVLITGARGGGKSTVARWLCAALLCRSELDPDGPCGACRTCRKVASAQHPDLHVLDRARDQHEVLEFNKSRYVIKIDQVRAMQEVLAHHAVEGRARVLVIDHAEHLEEEPQNALLKTLEEPGADTFVLLVTSQPEALLPTVRSRLQRLPVLPLPPESLLGELSRRVPERKQYFDRATALARGSLGLALEYVTEQAVQLHDLVLSLLDSSQGLRVLSTARAVLAAAGDAPMKQAQARGFLLLLRAELAIRLRAHLEAHADTVYAASPSEPWSAYQELAVAAVQDLDLKIPPEQALVGCLLQMQPTR
ncbi:MAG TPA: AAA family ATPase, partial [Planctomycetota bacterium]|nr:AAA family ATPase [Planctomycetota bacterium]